MARIEPRICDDLTTSPQNRWLGHFRQQQSSQRFADADDAEQQVASAAQFDVLVDRLANGPVDRRELTGEIVNRCSCHLDGRAVAKTAAETILPLRPVRDQA